MKLHAYFRLMRLNKPSGMALLWLPTAWALWVSNHGTPPYSLLIYFFLGTLVMRSAGCVVNDIADRNIDKHVSRTTSRPLTSGEIGLLEAMTLLTLLLFVALFILIQLPPACFYYAVFAVFITCLYPFCKRFFQAPQLLLGLAFSMGIPMAYVASNAALDTTLLILFILNFTWIVAYDTMYAMADREDDLRIGVKSTAILFAQHDDKIILALNLTVHGLWLVLARIEHYSQAFYITWALAAGVLIYQQRLIQTRQPTQCLQAFSISTVYGLMMWFGLIISESFT